MSAHPLLSRLVHLKQTGPYKWIACCPSHADKSPSLSIRGLPDGRVLLHCFAGCDVNAVCGSVGLQVSDLYPPRPVNFDDRTRPTRENRPFSAEDALRLTAFEAEAAARLILCAVKDELDPDQRKELANAASVISRAREACGLREVQS